MSACTSTWANYGRNAKCERENRHSGDHQDSSARWIWSDGGGHGMSRDASDCPSCGTRDVRSDIEKERVEGDQCGSCDFWDEVTEQYRAGQTVVQDGRAYTWNPDHPWGFGGAKVLITKADGTTLGPGPGLWHRGNVPHERRNILADNATIEWRSR